MSSNDIERERFVRICDCENGRFISSISYKQIELIYDIIVKSAIDNGDWITDPMKKLAFDTITELRDYLNDASN